MVATAPAELAGLPDDVVAAAARQHQEQVFSLRASVRKAVPTHADSRPLRRRMYEAYASVARPGPPYDNTANTNRLISLRTRKAHLLGFASFAHYQTDALMAGTVEAAESLLHRIEETAVEKAKTEAADMQVYVDRHDGGFKHRALTTCPITQSASVGSGSASVKTR